MNCVHELFEEQVARNPDAIAVLFNDSKLTYRELDQRAMALAGRLRALGVGPGVLVAVFVDRSLEMVTALLAVLKAGGAYVPLDPTHPRKRLAYLLGDARPLVVLTQRHLEPDLPAHDARVVVIDNEMIAEPSRAAAPSSPSCGPHDLAYVIYTSGSTGDPKGVEIEHRSVVNMLSSMRRRPGFGAEDRMLAITTLTFDIAALELFLPLTTGACVVIAPRETTVDGVALAQIIERSGVTVIQATPSTLRMLLDAEWSGAPDLKILCGGEAWAEELAERLLERCGSLWNMYGPTETTVWSSVAKIEKGRPVVLGPPIANTRFYVLDHAAQLVPIGIPGELYIGGEGLARGYLRRDQLTRERFLVDPYSTAPGARMYRTGDQVRRLTNGTLEFLGRLDHQVKIRGHRVELGEIEARMLEHPAVREAVVVAREDTPEDKRIVAYFIGEADCVTELRVHLASVLPEYMVPAAYVHLQAMPLTPNGKLDRAALPKPGESAFGARHYEAPVGPVEEAIAGIWSEFLDLEHIGRHDSFFDLGGHSLMALRVIGKINKALGSHLRVPTFFQEPSIFSIASALQKDHHDKSEPRLILLRAGGRGVPIYFVGSGPTEHRLATLITEDHPVYAVDVPVPMEWARAVDEPNPTLAPTFRKLAALYADVLFDHAKSSPCIIAGHCLGGKIAFEATHELQRRGGNVAQVLLIDAWAFSSLGATRGPVWQSLKWIWRDIRSRGGRAATFLVRSRTSLYHLLRLVQWSVTRVPRMVKGRVDLVSKRFRSEISPSGYTDTQGMPIDQMVLNRMLYAAIRAWRPSPIDTQGVLFRAKVHGEELLAGYDFGNGWSDLFNRGFEVVHSSGDHFTMVIGENLLDLAGQMNAVIDQSNSAPARRLKHAEPELDVEDVSVPRKVSQGPLDTVPHLSATR